MAVATYHLHYQISWGKKAYVCTKDFRGNRLQHVISRVRHNLRERRILNRDTNVSKYTGDDKKETQHSYSSKQLKKNKKINHERTNRTI